MIKLSTLFWLLAVSTVGFAMFAVKYEVQSLADQLARMAKQTNDTERGIRVLDAEWAYLNRPDTLAQLNQRFLSLGPIATKQLRASVADIPMRPPPAPSEAVVADRGASTDTVPAPQNSSAPPAAAPDSTPPASPNAGSAPAAAPVLTAQIAAASARRAPVKVVSRPSAAHHARSLDELIAQITENRE